MTEIIVNLTQHSASAEQLTAGVVDMPDRKLVSDLLTFDELPTEVQLINRAETLASLINQPAGTAVMIGGAPFFMSFLIESLKKRGFIPVFAFSKRVVSESNGVKTSVFRHEGFINARL